jgi:dienelactone hydrolase
MYSEKIQVAADPDYPLNGLLTIPDGNRDPLPAIVMVHGSGASNMDEKVLKLTPFKDLAEGLAKRGIASLRYDKRTFAHGRKCARQKDITVREETIDDALAALDLLKSDPRIDPERIYILGHSMGAMLAPRIGAAWGCARGLIMMAGTPFRLEDIVLRQLKQGQSGNPLMRLILNAQYKKYARLFDGLYEMSDEESLRKKFAGNLTLYYFKEMGQKTAVDYLLESDLPALILQGGKDFQVLENEDFVAFREQLKDRPGIEYKVYPELNHCFVNSLYSDILKASKEYGTERHIPEEVFDDIAAFLA